MPPGWEMMPWYGMIFGSIMMITVLVTVVVVVVILVRWLGGGFSHGDTATRQLIGKTPLDILKERFAELAERYDLKPKTVMKWRNRDSVEDMAMGPKNACSTVLTAEEEALCVAFRKHTLLPLDDCLYALQATISHLTRSSLHRLFQRYEISRLPDIAGEKPPKKKFKSYPIGYFYVDIAEVRTEDGKLHMFVAIDRTSKFTFVDLHERATRRVAADFLKRLIEAVPYTVHTVLTDNGTQFTTPGNAKSMAGELLVLQQAGQLGRVHAVEWACAQNHIDQRLTKPNHPWTNGQVERMNRTLKEATVRRYYYESHDQLREHLAAFVNAYNFAKRLKTLKGLTPFEYVTKCWTDQPNRFKVNPIHHSMGLNI
jgi:transposase InsO family protein